MSEATEKLNFFDQDENLQVFLNSLPAPLSDEDKARLSKIGHFAATRLDEQARVSDAYYPPQLRDMPSSNAAPHPRKNLLTINPEYEACQQEMYKNGILARVFDTDSPAPHLLTFLTQYLVSKADISTGCPLAMTHPAAVLLDKMADQKIKDQYLPEILNTEGNAVICGTWATERHSGSDVGGTTTTAQLNDANEKKYRLHGHQYFTSAFGFKRFIGLKTARPEGGAKGSKGLGLYLVPSHIDEDWSIGNNLDVTSLKRKLGTKGLPTVEVDLNGALAYEIAPEGKGIHAMMAALGCSRVHNAMAAAGSMHRSYIEAVHWAEERVTFGKPLIERPMVQKRILDIATQWKAGSALAFEAALSYDVAAKDPAEEPWMRIVTALAKYKTAEQSVWCAQKALELVGGNGYTEDYATARLFRDSMVLPVWEGPEQIQALELMRMVGQNTQGNDLFVDKIEDMIETLPDEMKSERSTLNLLLDDLYHSLGQLKNNPQDTELVADEFLHLMSNVLTYALMCKEAAWELEHNNDSGKLLFTRNFYQGLQNSGFGAPSFEPSDLHKNFNAVIEGIAIAKQPQTDNDTETLDVPAQDAS